MSLARSFAGEGKRHAGCALIRNQRDTRVRVLHNSAPFIFGLGLILHQAPLPTRCSRDIGALIFQRIAASERA